MVNLQQFRANADKEGICEEYALLWDKAGSKKQLMEIAMSSQGADFLCDSIAKGWGISPDEISSKFSRYLNGAFVYHDVLGYSSVLYCQHFGTIEVEDTLVILIDSDVVLSVPDMAVCEVYATGVTTLSIIGGGHVRLVAYGNPANVVVESVSEDCKFRRVQKRERER